MNSGLTHEAPVEGESIEWYTPPHIFRALGVEFDLDPCSPPGGLPWVPAQRALSIEDDGLRQRWNGRVWLNPPYGKETGAWVEKLSHHGDGIALVFARTDTAWFQAHVPYASRLCFIRGRLAFVGEDGRPLAGRAGAPSVLIAFGEACGAAVERADLGLSLPPPSLPVGRLV